MTGETNLTSLIRGMEPVLQDGAYVFVTLAPGAAMADGLQPRMVFEEAEGTTLIVLRDRADACGLAAEFPCRMITLNIHSSLAAVGFLAAVAAHLAGHGMGVNPVSGYYHDHLFVPEDRADDAMEALHALAGGEARESQRDPRRG